MVAATMGWAAVQLMKRVAEDDSEAPDPSQREISTSWSLFILIILLISALFASYILQTRRIQAVHETVLSIFAGMIIGLILRLAASDLVLSNVSFNYQMFFNLLLPPIILASGYELHQANFFRNIGAILTFAFAGTFISAVVLGLVIFIWTSMNLDGVRVQFIDAIAVGATLSATDPVTILAIFNAYKVDPKLYTVIFGESILNDAIAIVLFETAQKYKSSGHGFGLVSMIESIGGFLIVFFGSLVIGLIIGMITSLLLKFTYLRRFPKTESCIIILIAYASYFFSNAIQMSGIVSLLFCGICLKHYAYYNMSRRTQLTTKFIFQVTAQLSENFIFIYLGLSLFTERMLVFKPLFILITIIGICLARWCAVFPLSRAINWVIRYRARRQGVEPEELPYAHQMMLFWAGLRGAVGVALAAGLTGSNALVLKATVLVVVVLTVIIFGGTTARMLEILNIRTGVVEEIDSDDEFDIEFMGNGAGSIETGTFIRKAGLGIGHNPRNSNNFAMGTMGEDGTMTDESERGTYSSGNVNGSAGRDLGVNGNTRRPNGRRGNSRSNIFGRGDDVAAERNLLSPLDSGSISQTEEDDAADLDLPPAPLRHHGLGRTLSPALAPGMAQGQNQSSAGTPTSTSTPRPYPTSGMRRERSNTVDSPHHHVGQRIAHATGAISQLISGLSEDPAGAFRQIDEGFIKPTLLLDPASGTGHGPGPGAGGSGSGNAHGNP